MHTGHVSLWQPAPARIMQAWQKHVGHKSYELLANAVMPEQSMLRQ